MVDMVDSIAGDDISHRPGEKLKGRSFLFFFSSLNPKFSPERSVVSGHIYVPSARGRVA